MNRYGKKTVIIINIGDSNYPYFVAKYTLQLIGSKGLKNRAEY